MPAVPLPLREAIPLLTERIDRREAVRRAAVVLGGAISAPMLATLLAACDAPRAAESGWIPRVLSSEQAELVATLAEQIIPATTTPGARGTGVHRFIDQMLDEYYSSAQRADFLAGLADVDTRARAAKKKLFVDLSASEQLELITLLDSEAYAGAARAGQHFFRTMKELTLVGYYTSEIGATRELKQLPIPGRFDGCVPFASIGRAWSA